MLKKPKKLSGLEKEIKRAEQKLEFLHDRRRGLVNFQPQTDKGKAAQSEALKKLHIEGYRDSIRLPKLRERLEVETVKFLLYG